jgi:ASPIC and UnbV./FG-GAP repeat.
LFIDRSDLLWHNLPMLSYGVAVTDIDGDGAFEWVVSGFGHPNRLLAWDGGRLVDRFDPILAAAERMTIGVAAADVDGDGREEVYFLNTDTFAGAKRYGDHLFAVRHGVWTDLFLIPTNTHAANRCAGRSVCAVDRFGTGRYGFLVANYGGPLRLYETNGLDQLDDAAPDAGLDYVTGGRALVSLPLVSPPGRMDIFAANEDSPNFLFVNQGDGTFAEQADDLGVADPHEHGRGVAALDADGNGKFDLCVGNWQGEHRLFLQSPMGGFLEAATPEMARPAAVRTVIAADFDNDGYEEIFFNNIGEPNRLFAFRGGAWKRVPIGDADEPGGLGTGAAVADLDGDGRLELLIAHGESDLQPLSLYHAGEGKENDWLRVLPLTPAGAPARGALVLLTTPARVQRRVIDAGSGYLCQMEPVAHFGLGVGATVERVDIVWPGGATASIMAPASRQTLRVPHP